MKPLRRDRAVVSALRALALGAALILAAGAMPALAQQTVTSATLGGRVEDTNGAALPGVVVTATSTETNQSKTSTTDGEGRYRFSYLPVGDYELKVEKSGFTTLTKSLMLTVGQALDVPLALSVAGVAENVQVSSANPAAIETARTQVAETVLPKDVESLPLNGRNFLDLALLLPGVSRTNTGNVQRFAETSAVPGTGISIAGQRNLANSFIVDGSSANDDSVELAGTYYSQEVIREFQVVTSGAVAEFGRASGGFVNIVTQSGTNDLHGKAYGFLRNQRLDARNPLAPAKDPLTQTQYGGSFGAPVIKNRTFFFGNVEQTRRNDSNVITIAPSNVTAINNRLQAVGYSGPRIQTGLVPGGYDTTNLFARLDHQLNRRNSFTATYNFYDIGAVNARTVGGLNAVSRGTNLDNTDHTVNLQNITTVGSNSLNELRFQFRRSRLGAPAIDQTGPAVNINGVASFGTATSSPTERDIDLYQLTDNFSAVRGNHSLKFGGEYLYNDLDIGFPGALQGVYTFTNLANFLSGNYSQFQQAFGVPSQAQKNPNFGVFARDEWKVRRDLTLNVGVRYDLQFLPDPIETDTDNVAPRFGFAYTPEREDGHPGQLRSVLRPDTDARHLERLAARRLEVRRRHPLAREPRRSRLPGRARHAAVGADDQAERDAHRPQYREQFEPAGELASRARAAVGLLRLGRLHTPARDAHHPVEERERTALRRLRGCEPVSARPELRKHLALRGLGRLLLRRHGRLLQQAPGALGDRARLLHALEGD